MGGSIYLDRDSTDSGPILDPAKVPKAYRPTAHQAGGVTVDLAPEAWRELPVRLGQALVTSRALAVQLFGELVGGEDWDDPHTSERHHRGICYVYDRRPARLSLNALAEVYERAKDTAEELPHYTALEAVQDAILEHFKVGAR